MSTDIDSLFDSVPWEPFSFNGSQPLGYHKHHVPYMSNSNALQNLELWVISKDAPPPDPSSLRGVWIVYIHGGAWYDPQVTSASFAATVENLTMSHGGDLSKVAGIASLNYSLSSHPEHEKLPSWLRMSPQARDSSWTAKHPDHITDVLRGLAFLQKIFHFGSNFILVGHSCGAALAFQVLMDASRWDLKEAEGLEFVRPKTVIGLNGLYDFPSLVRDPGHKHAWLKDDYRTFIRGAFGDAEEVWRRTSPALVQSWSTEWNTVEGRKTILVQSQEDSLVPYGQLEALIEALQRSKSTDLQICEIMASGDHNDLWLQGKRLAEILSKVICSI